MERGTRARRTDLSSSTTSAPFASIFNCGAKLVLGTSLLDMLCLRTGSFDVSTGADLAFTLQTTKGGA